MARDLIVLVCICECSMVCPWDFRFSNVKWTQFLKRLVDKGSDWTLQCPQQLSSNGWRIWHSGWCSWLLTKRGEAHCLWRIANVIREVGELIRYKGTPPSRSEVPGVPHPISEHHLSFWMPSVIQDLPLNAWCLKSGLIYVLHEPDFFQHFYCFFCRLGNVPLLELPEVIPSQRY